MLGEIAQLVSRSLPVFGRSLRFQLVVLFRLPPSVLNPSWGDSCASSWSLEAFCVLGKTYSLGKPAVGSDDKVLFRWPSPVLDPSWGDSCASGWSLEAFCALGKTYSLGKPVPGCYSFFVVVIGIDRHYPSIFGRLPRRKNPFLVWENLFLALGRSCAFSQASLQCLGLMVISKSCSGKNLSKENPLLSLRCLSG